MELLPTNLHREILRYLKEQPQSPLYSELRNFFSSRGIPKTSIIIHLNTLWLNGYTTESRTGNGDSIIGITKKGLQEISSLCHQ